MTYVYSTMPAERSDCKRAGRKLQGVQVSHQIQMLLCVIFCWNPGILARPSIMMSETRSSLAGIPLLMNFFLKQAVHTGATQISRAVRIVTLGTAGIIYAAAHRLLRSQA